jgi:hypothetical protein
MAEAIRSKYGSDFKYVVQASWNFGHTLALGERSWQSKALSLSRRLRNCFL